MKYALVVHSYDETFEGYKQNVSIDPHFYTSFKKICEVYQIKYSALKMKPFPLESPISSPIEVGKNITKKITVYKLLNFNNHDTNTPKS